MTRLEQLIQYLKEEPHDPFNIYALALEYQKVEPGKAMELFDELLTKYSNYLPAYYHAGKLLVELEEFARAKEIFTRGMELAKISNDEKTFRELKNAFNEIEFD